MGPILPNLRRYLDVLITSWQKQNETDALLSPMSMQKRDELKFLPAALEVTETPAPPLGRALMFSISVCFALAIGWAMIGQIEITAKAEGKIIDYNEGNSKLPLSDDVSIEVEAFITNNKIALVTTKQKAIIKVDDLLFSKYGSIDGHVRYVAGMDTGRRQSTSTYPIRISMNQVALMDGDESIQLRPGMSVTVDIIVGRQRIIDFIMVPLHSSLKKELKGNL